MKTPGEFALEQGFISEEGKELAKKLFKQDYYMIKEIFKKYCDLKESHYTILSLWVLGTYIHKAFNSYPYIYINAIKGAGKTRILKLIESMCWNGKITTNLTEAVLFRTASRNTILIDEFEGVAGKDKNSIRELLNSAYKKGSIVERMRKMHTKDGEVQMIEKFEVYTPVVMANIWGMHEVLGDRCITLIIDKSSDVRVVRLMENYTEDFYIHFVKRTLNELLVYLCSYFTKMEVYKKWNYYINLQHNYTSTYSTYTTLTSLTTLTEKEEELAKTRNFVLGKEEIKLFEKIIKSEIIGRELELFFPLFLTANLIGEDVFDEILEIAKSKVEEKREEELIESKDVCLLDFVSKKTFTMNYMPLIELMREFRSYYQYDNEDSELKWLNARWMGRALKRLGLILDKRRMSQGIEVSLNISKAKEKYNIFKQEKGKK